MFNDVTLIFEGADRCGKSSLIEGFRKQYHDFRLEKMRVPRKLHEAVQWYEEFFQTTCNGRGNKIWDRGHISEAVYAPLYRDYVHLNWPSTLWKFEETYFRGQAVFIVYVYPVWTELLKPDDRKGANLQRELSAYDVALGQTSLPVINITKHMTSHVAWRSEEAVIAELVDKVDEQLSLIGR